MERTVVSQAPGIESEITGIPFLLERSFSATRRGENGFAVRQWFLLPRIWEIMWWHASTRGGRLGRSDSRQGERSGIDNLFENPTVSVWILWARVHIRSTPAVTNNQIRKAMDRIGRGSLNQMVIITFQLLFVPNTPCLSFVFVCFLFNMQSLLYWFS